MSEIQAVEYYDVIIDDSGKVKEFRAHYLKETPQIEIDRLNALHKRRAKERALADTLFEATQNDATPQSLPPTFKLAF